MSRCFAVMLMLPICCMLASCMTPATNYAAIDEAAGRHPLPDPIVRLVRFEVPPFPAYLDQPEYFQKLHVGEAKKNDVVSFAQLNAGVLRGRRILEWTDQYYSADRKRVVAYPESVDQYMMSAVIAKRADLEDIEAAYLPLLLDKDDEVRHLGAHTLIMAYLYRSNETRVSQLRNFCRGDTAEYVQRLASESHTAFVGIKPRH